MQDRPQLAACLAIVLATACAHPVRMATAPGALTCRTLVSDGSAASLRWMGPDDPAERRALDARCAALRPALFVEGTAAVPRVRRLAIVTWNLHDGRGDLARLLGDLRERRQGVPPPDAIVLLLQEFVRTGPPEATRTVLRSIDVPPAWHLLYVPARRTDATSVGAAYADRGMAIVSSLPLSQLEAIELPVERQRRLAIAATVRGVTASGQPWRLRIVNAHLENRPGARRWWIRAGAARTRQAEALLDALDLPPSTVPTSWENAVVLGGDFNTWLGGREQALRLLRDAFSAWSTEDTRATLGFRRRLDYLFARLPAGTIAIHRRLDDRYGSDHHPVVAAVDFGEH